MTSEKKKQSLNASITNLHKVTNESIQFVSQARIILALAFHCDFAEKIQVPVMKFNIFHCYSQILGFLVSRDQKETRISLR
jgi:hypothetical protein